MKVAVIRKSHFNAAHRLYVDSWSNEKNVKVFSKCCNPYYHGHNYEIEVKVVGEVDPISGMVIDLKVLKEIIEEHISDYFDHRNLNEEIEEFKTLNPSAENIAIVSYNILREKIDSKLDLFIKLYETPRNFVEYPVV